MFFTYDNLLRGNKKALSIFVLYVQRPPPPGSDAETCPLLRKEAGKEPVLVHDIILTRTFLIPSL
jgi:hypothetical protein